MTDGAAAMIIASADFAERHGLPVRARFAHFAVAAEDPVLVLSAPVPVTYKLMERTGMKIDDFDAVECNEAFAAIALMWQKEFDYPMERFNPRGGAIALGPPARRVRRRADDAPAPPPRSHRRPLRLPDHVRRRRPSQRHRHRTPLSAAPLRQRIPSNGRNPTCGVGSRPLDDSGSDRVGEFRDDLVPIPCDIAPGDGQHVPSARAEPAPSRAIVLE